MGRLTMRRRTMLGAGLAAAAGGAALTLPSLQRGRWRFFTEAEARTVDAVCEQLIPADGDAGARQAGVANYIDIQLTRHFKRYQRAYRQGIAGIDRRSLEKFSRPFANLTSAEQVEVMREVERTQPSF